MITMPSHQSFQVPKEPLSPLSVTPISQRCLVPAFICSKQPGCLGDPSGRQQRARTRRHNRSTLEGSRDRSTHGNKTVTNAMATGVIGQEIISVAVREQLVHYAKARRPHCWPKGQLSRDLETRRRTGKVWRKPRRSCGGS